MQTFEWPTAFNHAQARGYRNVQQGKHQCNLENIKGLRTMIFKWIVTWWLQEIIMNFFMEHTMAYLNGAFVNKPGTSLRKYNIRRKTFATKIPLVALDKLHVIFVTNNRDIGWTKKSTNTSSSFDSIVYVLSHAIKMQLFWSLLRTNNVLPHVPIFSYLK